MNGFTSVENTAIKRLSQCFWQQFLAGVLAGIFTSIAYTVTIFVICEAQLYSSEQALITIAKVIGCALYSISTICTCIFGAGLLTGNCIGFVSCFNRKTKWKYLFYNLSITFIGNFIGCICCALLISLLPIFTDTKEALKANDLTILFLKFAQTKITTSWWQVLIGAIFCNFLVLGSVICYNSLENKTAGIIIIILFIAVYMICGFNQVVSNMFLGPLWGFITIFTHNLSSIDKNLLLMGSNIGKFFYCSIIPSTIGNIIGGCILSWFYFAINIKIIKSNKS